MDGQTWTYIAFSGASSLFAAANVYEYFRCRRIMKRNPEINLDELHDAHSPFEKATTCHLGFIGKFVAYAEDYPHY